MKARTDQNDKRSLTVGSFLEAGKEPLKMKLVAGQDGLSSRITEAAINRSGLALTGFFKYFAYRRIQVFGLAEYSYLSSLSRTEKEKRLKAFFAKKMPCVVVARNMRIFASIRDLGEHYDVPILQSSMITKDFLNAATIIMENMMSPRVNVHGTMVEILGMGVLIEGDAGMGKSESALSLIKRGHALVSDDITTLRIDSSGSLVGAPVMATRYHMEIKGVGLIHVPSLFGVASVREEKKLDFVVSLCKPGQEGEMDWMGRPERRRRILGVELPQVMVPVAPGRDIANIIETAALDFKLRRLGHDAVKELDERLIALMKDGRSASE